MISGRMFRPGKYELIVGKAAQSQFAGLGEGQSVALPEGDWTVTGTFESRGDAHESEFIMDSATLYAALRASSYKSMTVMLESPAALARFMFRADAALQVVSSLSGGQLLRAALACVLGGPKPPALLMLDEPTNHLDIESIEAVEAGLRAYDGALLVASHDEAFLEAIGISRRLELPMALTAVKSQQQPTTSS